ncbi:glycoside hydrolase family 1 protein [Bifidobacterium tissieri]|uniref:beta-glucosidase n=1 Tax=Bifidobacterium tissieri TaxID=1630162 RepID=A0A5M9ZI17_9BIFI|nr:family 1 glycosylhydrolase [Bifidobacterium tissieri]KAA8827148.1 glycoside hydrolase family 1 protein [Bifidobacterium tissieri]KAA8830014.1 glycoside hydrolase family 1 protein [Bifidobacterium tissieri]
MAEQTAPTTQSTYNDQNHALTFPRDFYWGASTAAHQIEGNNIASDWWADEHRTPANPRIAEPSGDACDSYNRYEDDIRLLAESGLTMYRFSIEWARIEPVRGHISQAQLLHYRDMIDTCRKYGVEPMVTLLHFTTPQWFAEHGGWEADDCVELFCNYVRTVMPILDGVTWVCTINEPNMLALLMYGAPDDQGEYEPNMTVAHNLVAAHKAARKILHTDPRIRSGWTVAAQNYEAANGLSDEALAEFSYPREEFFLEAAAGDAWLGVQAYLRTLVGPDGPLPVADGMEKTLTGWEYFPPALGIALRKAWKHGNGTPLFVTENGIATSDDERRKDYTFGALTGMREAMDDGIPVLGYLHWSLLDNYEWGSFKPTFGLIAWDKTTFERHPKSSLSWLGGIAKSGVAAR